MDNKYKLFLKVSDPTYSGSPIIISEDLQDDLMGFLILNRTISSAYKNLNLSLLHRDIFNALSVLVNSNFSKAINFRNNLKYISKILQKADFKYALLKGALLSTILYETGDRTSNDIDILVESQNVSSLQKILLENGFIQGWFDDSQQEIIAATRRQIVEARLNFGETVPFIKLNDNCTPIVVDINFSVDFKPEINNNVVSKLLENTITYENEDILFKSLNQVDFFIHLCCHLYKEATTFDWVQRRRDLDLYKFCDLVIFLKKYANVMFFEELMIKIEKYKLSKEIYYSVKNCCFLFPSVKSIQGINKMLQQIEPDNLSFMTEVIKPEEKQVYYHNYSFLEWFCLKDRRKYLLLKDS